MIRRCKNRVLLVFMMMSLCGQAEESSLSQVVLLHINDFHSQLEFSDALLVTIENLRSKYPDSLLLNAGDAFEVKVPKVALTQGEVVVDFLNRAGFDAMTLGDNEFDGFRLKEVKSWIERFNFPVLSANLVEMDSGDPLVLPYWIFTKNQAVIGVLGIYDEESLQSVGVKAVNPKKVVRYYVKRLRNKVDCLILLSHQGLTKDREMAQNITGIDVIVGGSSQKALEQPEKWNDCLIVQAGAYGRYVGVLELQINRDLNHLHAYQGRLVAIQP